MTIVPTVATTIPIHLPIYDVSELAPIAAAKIHIPAIAIPVPVVIFQFSVIAVPLGRTANPSIDLVLPLNHVKVGESVHFDSPLVSGPA